MSPPVSYKVLALVVTSMTFIVIGDTAGKTLTAGGVSPFFVAWTRFGLAALILLPFAGLQRHELRSLLDWRVILRALLIVSGVCAILTALRTEPIANVFGGFFIGPVVAFFLSAVALRERITPARTVLILVSFAGVLLVVKSGFDMRPGMAFAVLAGVFHGAYLVATRWLAGSFRPRFLLFSQLAVGGVALMLPGLATNPESLGGTEIAKVTLSALASASGNYILVSVNRTTPANVIAPLVYSQLLAATLIGYLVFGDWPDSMAMAGLVVITLSGLSSLSLARRAARRGAG